MTPKTLLQHNDAGERWPDAASGQPVFADLAAAYQTALAVRALRIARGETPRGFKIGFTNRNIWPRYQVFAPIWGSVWSTTLANADADGAQSLAHFCQPRIEPEAVFGMKASPLPNADIDDLFEALEWVAPGFEIVQSHRPNWQFTAPETVADGGLHARLLVGPKIAITEVARDARQLDERLASCQVSLRRDGVAVEEGVGANVLDSPLRALLYFLNELRQCPGAPELKAGDVVTTGTWTDAWPVRPGETWRADFGAPLGAVGLAFR